MIRHDITFGIAGQTIAAYAFEPSGINPRGQLLFLHGAGRATKERAQPVMAHLAEEYSIASFSFDFSGHGQSSGTLAESSLERRYKEAREAIYQSGFSEPLAICAFSMGGHIAIQLLREFMVHSLVLFYPAIYTVDAVDIPFGNPEFSSTIRKQNSWQASDGFNLLRRFSGNLLLIVGDQDEVVPRTVTDRIMSSAEIAKRKELVVLDRTPHLVLPKLYEDRERFEGVCALIADFVTPSDC